MDNLKFSNCLVLQLLQGKPGGQPVEIKELREKQALQRSNILRVHAGYIPEHGVRQRKHFLTAKVGCWGPGNPACSG